MVDTTWSATSDSTRRGYWVCAIIALLIGAVSYLYMFIKLQGSKVKNGFMYYAFFPVFASDVLLIINFVPRDFYHLSVDKIETGGWCQVSAFLAVAGIVSLNVSMISISYMTRELVADRLNKDRSKSIMMKSMAVGWGLGIIFAAILAGAKQLGNFRDFYCCIPSPQNGSNIVPYSIITLVAFSSMIYFYRQAYAIAEEKWQLSAASKKRKARQADNEKGARPAQVQEVVVLAVWTTGTFYVLWFLVSLLGFITILGINTYPAELDAIAGVILKLQPLCNSLIMIRSILRTK
eukprot:TRINITY_DN2385_c0_g1_i1.p1 TRINITY_DN2385_c0_g1~~TRINITY_DN2385_c0_g1_i1.p1  ORF type:complete len:292 (-),score=69.24 TRINITY_DN2385_c0_g1_i1:70-945(-)